MIESVRFENFKALRDTMLPLSRFTLIVGPNGSGKSTALLGVLALGRGIGNFEQLRTAGLRDSEQVTISAKWQEPDNGYVLKKSWSRGGGSQEMRPTPDNTRRAEHQVYTTLAQARIFSLDANAIAHDVQLQPNIELGANGSNLAVVLDQLRDQHPERFDALNEEISRWLPEFDRVLFETPRPGHRGIALRTSKDGHIIKANDLSQGTLVALALLTLAYLPNPPSVVCLEEPDHGLHPRLLRDVRDAIYRLAYPESAGEKRASVQVIATTHNPYFLDLFREHPEEIVIAEKVGLEAKFSRLSDRTDLDEILGDAHLGDVWYSGVLGGVPAGT